MFSGFLDRPDLSKLRLQLLADGADCAHCPLGRQGQASRPVGTDWPHHSSPTLAIVGEAPGRREVQVGRPFMGPSGKLLDRACAQGGVNRGGIAILNAAACGPIPSANERMKEQATAACRPRLLTELRRLRPQTILAVGSYALRALSPAGAAGVSALRGALLPLASDVIEEKNGNVDVHSVGAFLHSAAQHGSLSGRLGSAPLASDVDADGERQVEVDSSRMGELSKRLADTPRSGPRWQPFFLSTFHPAHILRGGDGDAPESPGGETGPAVDLLYFFFLYDLAKAQRLARGEIAPWQDDLDLFVARGDKLLHPIFDDDDVAIDFVAAEPNALQEAVSRVYDEAEEWGKVASDVETDSKDAMRAGLTAIALTTTHGGLSATWAAWQLEPKALRLAGELFADKRISKIFHNRIYDTIVLPRHGLPVLGPVDDTLLKHHAAFPGLPHKLQSVATQFFATRPWKAEFRRTEKDDASLILYNGRDTTATARLDVALDKLLDVHRVKRVYEADRQQFAVATHMRQTGYWVDRIEQKRQSNIQHARLEYMRGQLALDFKSIEEPWRQALARILAQLQRKKDPDSYLDRVALRYREIAERDQRDTDIGIFKPKAHKDMIALFEVLKIPILDYTKTGAPKTDKKAMEGAAGRHPLMRRIIHLREAKHLLATYIDGLPILSDGRVHPDWSPKITGRWGAGKAQNWPKFVQGWPPVLNADGSYKTRPSGDLITPKENPRRLVTAPTASELLAMPAGELPLSWRLRASQGHGRMLVGADFSQVELRVVGFLACDQFLLDIFRSGADPHAAFARECFPAQFPQLEADFERECKALGRKIKIKGNLTNPGGDGYVADLDDATRKRLAAIAALWSRLRDLTKRAEYCGIYGGGAETVYDSIVKDFPEVQLRDLQKLIDAINSKMSGVVAWRNQQELDARANREIRESLLGRVRMFPLGNFNKNIVYNFPIQAFAASLLARAIFRFTVLTHPELLQCERLYSFGLLDAAWVTKMQLAGFDKWKASCDLLLNGHDSLVAECDDEDADQCVQLLEASMHQELPMAGEIMVFPAEAAKGRRWSDT